MNRNSQRMYFMSLTSLIGLLCCLLILSSCGTQSSGSLPKNALQVTRASNDAGNLFPPFTQTITDPTTMAKLYHAIQTFPHFRSGEYSCPIDFGLEYHLTFSHSDGSEQQVILHARGCPYTDLNSSDRRAISQNFWPLFAQIIGIPQAELFPMPRPGS
jgi:hypothetical protein